MATITVEQVKSLIDAIDEVHLPSAYEYLKKFINSDKEAFSLEVIEYGREKYHDTTEFFKDAFEKKPTTEEIFEFLRDNDVSWGYSDTTVYFLKQGEIVHEEDDLCAYEEWLDEHDEDENDEEWLNEDDEEEDEEGEVDE